MLANQEVQKMMVAEMRMIWWMCGYTRLDKIRNVVFKEKVGVAPIKDKVRNIRLRRFGHKRSVDAPMRRRETVNLTCGRRGEGLPKTSWNGMIRCDLNFMGLTKDMVQDKSH